MTYKFSHMACGLFLLVAPSAILVRDAVAEDLKSPTIPAKPDLTKVSDTPQNATEPDKGHANASTPAVTKRSGPQLTEDKFKDWSLQCIVNSPTTPPCQIIYRLTSPDHKQVVLVLSLALYSKDKPRLQMALPLGFSIPRGVHIAFGKDYSLTAQVSRCTIQGCLVEGEGQAKMIDAMLKEKGGSASVYNMQGAQIRLPISLDGFSAAYEMLRKKAG